MYRNLTNDLAPSKLIHLLFMGINGILLVSWTSDARYFLCSDIHITYNKKQCLAVGDCLTKHNFADVRDLMALISADNLWKYDSNLAIFPAFAIFPSITLLWQLFMDDIQLKYCYETSTFIVPTEQSTTRNMSLSAACFRSPTVLLYLPWPTEGHCIV